jgi:hypothetical protein
MLRLGNIFKRHGNLLEAVQLRETAMPLFICSSQAKQVEHINERPASVNSNVLEQHGVNSVRFAGFNVPSVSVENLNNIGNSRHRRVGPDD